MKKEKINPKANKIKQQKQKLANAKFTKDQEEFLKDAFGWS